MACFPHDHDPNLVILGVDVCGLTDEWLLHELQHHGLQYAPLQQRRLTERQLVSHLQKHLDGVVLDCPVSQKGLGFLSCELMTHLNLREFPVELMSTE